MSNSHLVNELSALSSEMSVFPLLVGSDEIGHFHSVRGRYSTSSNLHVVEFVHEVQGVGSPDYVPTDSSIDSVEAHLQKQFVTMNVQKLDATSHTEYPDKPYVLTAHVTSYMNGEHSFSEALLAPADKRETRHQPNGERQ